MVGPIRDLDNLSRRGGTVRAECLTCGRVALFAPTDLAAHWRGKGWDCSWPNFARHLVCRRPEGRGTRGPKVSWLVGDPPPRDDGPPRPRFTRSPLPAAPVPIDLDAWRRKRA